MRTIHYKTLKGFMRANGIRQFTLEDFRSGQIYSSRKGWIKFKLSEETENEYVRGITGVIWAKVTDERMHRVRYAKSMGILRSVQSASKSGMSRVIAFREIAKCGKKFTILQFDWFLEQLGYTAKNNGISVGGCGMDMIFHTLNSVAGTLKANGFKVPENHTILAEHYHHV